MDNKLVKVGNGRYSVINADGNTIAMVYRSGKGYTRDILNVSGVWFHPEYFNYFRTLSDVKRRYDIK